MSVSALVSDGTPTLEDQITELAGHLNAGTYRFLRLLAAFDEEGGWQGDGVKSFAHWLNYKCGIGSVEAREKVRVARAMRDLPLIDAAFEKGEISYSKVRAMTRVATPKNESFLLMIAQYGTASHMERLIRKFTHAKARCAEYEGAARLEERSFQGFFDGEGFFNFRGRLPKEEGTLLLKALDALVEDLMPKPEGGDAQESEKNASAETSFAGDDVAQPESFPHRRRIEALVHMAEESLKRQSIAHTGTMTGDRYQLMLHINANPGSLDCKIAGGPASFLEDGEYLPLEVAKRLACDGSLTLIAEDNEGKVLNIGRKTRIVPKAMRQALTLRDNGCRFPGCHQSKWLHAHHIKHWADGGETRLDNLVSLCGVHHRLIHDGTVTVTTLTGGFAFMNNRLKRRMKHAYPQYPHVRSASESVSTLIVAEKERNIDIDAGTAVTKWRGEIMDYHDAVSTMFGLM